MINSPISALFLKLLLLIFILACNKSKAKRTNYNIDANTLVALIEKGSVSEFENLVRRAGYRFTDTTATKEYHIYLANDTINGKDKLHAHVTNDQRELLTFISLEIHDQKHFDELRKHFISLGFMREREKAGIEKLNKRGTLVEILLMKGSTEPQNYRVFIGKDPG